MTYKWKYCPLTAERQEPEEALKSKYSAIPVITQLLAQRGITTLDEAQDFFSPQLAKLHDPFLMPDMDKAVARLNRAMGMKEKILVFGDYDVDGTTAVALVYRFLRSFYSNVDYYIPTRYDDGYGISTQNIDAAAEDGVKLIIILDCGIKANAEIAYAKQKGIDFIICDHHMADEELPQAAAILNPKLKGSSYPCPHLSGCGVGFKLMQAFAISNAIGFTELYGMLDLVAVSIAADIVPIVGENRILAYHGLRRLNFNPNLGLRAIIRTCGLQGNEITISDVVFKIGPRINASGRMQSGKEAVELLTARDMGEAINKAHEINQYNHERKEMDQKVTKEAIAYFEQMGDELKNRKAAMVYKPDWHKGVIGIVASRLTEMYYKPSVVLTMGEDGIVTGSSRSAQGFDVYAAVDSTRDLLENFGGHAYAVGMSMKEENVTEFMRRFEEYVAAHITEEQQIPLADINAEVTFADLTPDFIARLRRFNPYGASNPKPVFRTHEVMDFGTSKLVGRNNEHLKLEVVDPTCGKVYNGIAFNKAHLFDDIHAGKQFSMVYTIEESKRQPATVQLQIKEIKITS